MRLPTFVFALALAAAPAFAVNAAPSTGNPAALPGTAEYTPDGAPHDDYNFVAWCEGVLEGHMALAEHVQTVLPLDEVQQKIGKAYLKGYAQALDIGKRGRSEAELDAAQAVRHAARANWNTAMGADLQLGADTYLAWQLPGRCEHAAKRVAKRDDIFKLAPSLDEVETLGAGSVSDAPVGAAPAPAPAVVAAAPVEAPAAPAEEPVSAAGPVGQSWQTEEPAADDTATADTATTDAAASDASTTDMAPTEMTADAAAPAEDAEATTVAAADPAPTPPPPAPAPAAETRTSDGKVVHMPRKGRLFPWGKRE